MPCPTSLLLPAVIVVVLSVANTMASVTNIRNSAIANMVEHDVLIQTETTRSITRKPGRNFGTPISQHIHCVKHALHESSLRQWWITKFPFDRAAQDSSGTLSSRCAPPVTLGSPHSKEVVGANLRRGGGLLNISNSMSYSGGVVAC